MQLYSSEQNNYKYLDIIWFLLGFVFFLISTFSCSLIILLVVNNEWDIATYFSNSLVDFTLSTFPFLLLVPMIAGLSLSVIFFRKLFFVRQFSLYFSIFTILFSSIALSLILFYLGYANNLLDIAKQFSLYSVVEKNRQAVWQNPDFGLLSGEVGTITDLNDFLLIDESNNIWNIESSDPKISSLKVLQTGKFIKLIGRKSDDKTFEAKEIRQ